MYISPSYGSQLVTSGWWWELQLDPVEKHFFRPVQEMQVSNTNTAFVFVSCISSAVNNIELYVHVCVNV